MNFRKISKRSLPPPPHSLVSANLCLFTYLILVNHNPQYVGNFATNMFVWKWPPPPLSINESILGIEGFPHLLDGWAHWAGGVGHRRHEGRSQAWSQGPEGPKTSSFTQPFAVPQFSQLFRTPTLFPFLLSQKSCHGAFWRFWNDSTALLFAKLVATD